MAQGLIKSLLLALLLTVFGCQGKPSAPSTGLSGGGGKGAGGSGAGAEAPTRQSGDSGASEAQTLSKLLRSDDVSVRQWAGQQLVEDRAVAAQAVPALTSALNDSDDQVRWWAAVALGQLGAPAAPAIPVLTECVKHDSAWAVRSECVQAAARAASTGEEALPAILAALADEDEQVQAKGAVAFGQVKHWTPASVPALAKALEDERPWVRSRAAQSLGRVGPPARATVPALEKLMEDSDAQVRLSVRDALPKILNQS